MCARLLSGTRPFAYPLESLHMGGLLKIRGMKLALNLTQSPPRWKPVRRVPGPNTVWHVHCRAISRLRARSVIHRNQIRRQHGFCVFGYGLAGDFGARAESALPCFPCADVTHFLVLTTAFESEYSLRLFGSQLLSSTHLRSSRWQFTPLRLRSQRSSTTALRAAFVEHMCSSQHARWRRPFMDDC